jgi:hypothetical protein
MSAVLPAAAAERLSDLEVSAALAMGAAASANDHGKDTFHHHSESARSKLGAVAEAQRARHAKLNLLLNGIRQWLLKLPSDAALEDVSPPMVEPLAPAALEAALGSLRGRIGELRMEQHRVSAAGLPKPDLKKLARAYAADLAAKGAPKIELIKGQFLAEFHDRRLDVELVALPNLLAKTLAWADPDRFAQRLEDEIDAMPDAPLALSKTAQAKRLAELSDELDGLERKEEALVASAALAGQDILRRADASPAAVLGVRIAKRAAKAA